MSAATVDRQRGSASSCSAENPGIKENPGSTALSGKNHSGIHTAIRWSKLPTSRQNDSKVVPPGLPKSIKKTTKIQVWSPRCPSKFQPLSGTLKKPAKVTPGSPKASQNEAQSLPRTPKTQTFPHPSIASCCHVPSRFCKSYHSLQLLPVTSCLFTGGRRQRA